MISIVIPTKARAEKVYRQIAEVNKQLKSLKIYLEVELLIVENFSSELLDHTRIASANWNIKTAPTDFGGNHNFCNAILSAKGEFVWVLGDDDELTDDAVSTVINLAYEKNIECLIVNDWSINTSSLIPTDQIELFSSIQKLGPLIHISGYVVKREAFLRYCHDSILYQGTFMPQMIYALNCLKLNGLCLVDYKIFKKKVSPIKVVRDLYFVSALAAYGLRCLEIFVDIKARESWFGLVKRTRKTWLTPKGILYELAKYFVNDTYKRKMLFNRSISIQHIGVCRYVFYMILGNILLSSNYLSGKYVKLYEHYRGFSVNFRATVKFYE